MNLHTHTPGFEKQPHPHPGASRGLQRQCACGQHTPGGGECAGCRKKRLPAAPPTVHAVLRTPGRPLDPATRAGMEPRFGHDFTRLPAASLQTAPGGLHIGPANDRFEQEAERTSRAIMSGAPAGGSTASLPAAPADFSRVRVHTGPAAARSARDVSALAYTVGQDIVFGAGQYAPGTSTGQHLLSHELAHVVQQGGARAAVQRQPMPKQPPPACPPYEPGERANSYTAKGVLDVKVALAGFFSGLPEFLPTASPEATVVADFPVDSDQIKPAVRSTLAQVIGTYKPSDILEFIGFSDCVGPESRNEPLRKKRARAVADLFPSMGKIIGAAPIPLYPPTGPYLAQNTSPAGRALNRSVLIRLPKTPPPPPPPTPTPGVDITPEEPGTERCSPDQRRQLAIAFPAARLMAQKALADISDVNKLSDGVVIKFLLKRHFGQDALRHLPGIRAGFAKILDHWKNWESIFECEVQTKKECTIKKTGEPAGAYVMKNRHLFSPNQAFGTVHVCAGAFANPADLQLLASMVLHELSHRLDNTDDERYCGYQGEGLCSTLSAEDAIDNADSYAQFAREYFNVTM